MRKNEMRRWLKSLEILSFEVRTIMWFWEGHDSYNSNIHHRSTYPHRFILLKNIYPIQNFHLSLQRMNF